MAYDLQIGAATIYMEASNQPSEGQRAIAHVLVNRLKTGKWGKTIAAVAFKPLQFDCWMTSDPNKERLAGVPDNDPLLVQIEAYMKAAVDGEDDDPTQGATFYFNPEEVFPSWASKFVKTVSIGNHDFYRES